ncbi:hypothetical protein KAI12_05345 [Candidatus Bathyarchaeota archaeon]|nr:hypothetical protein [Candidatus Bathyarchaeota archaeon]
MPKKGQSKDEALEALDFIVNVLREHERDLDRMISELGNVTEQFTETGELSDKVGTIEEKINGLQHEIGKLIGCISKTPAQQSTPASVSSTVPTVGEKNVAEQPNRVHGLPVILRCKQWDDFQNLAFQAQTLSFMCKEDEKTFQADAIKGNQILTYSGELPMFSSLLKMWLSKQLDIPQKKILEGILAIG